MGNKKINIKWAFELSEILETRHKNEIEIDGLVEELRILNNGQKAKELKVDPKSIWSEIKLIVDKLINTYALDGKVVLSFWNIKKHIETIVFLIHRLKAIHRILKK